MTSSVFALLDAEWLTLGRRPVPEAWPVVAPVLAGRGRLAAVVDACRSGNDPAAANRALAGVLAVAATGDALARRTALQALVPVVAATAARLRGYVGWGPWATRAELDGDAAAALVELVGAGIPATAWPAAMVRSRLRDRLRTTVRRHARQRRREGTALDAVAGGGRVHPTGGLQDARSPEERAARAVVDAARRGTVSVAAAQTVLATSVFGWDPAAFAAHTGRDVRAVRTHRRRTAARLAALADTHLALAG
jgi:hypothetical protein